MSAPGAFSTSAPVLIGTNLLLARVKKSRNQGFNTRSGWDAAVMPCFLLSGSMLTEARTCAPAPTSESVFVVFTQFRRQHRCQLVIGQVIQLIIFFQELIKQTSTFFVGHFGHGLAMCCDGEFVVTASARRGIFCIDKLA